MVITRKKKRRIKVFKLPQSTVKRIRFMMAKGIVKSVMDRFEFVLFSNSDMLPNSLTNEFTVVNISGPIFRTILGTYSKVVQGRVFLLGTNSLKSVLEYQEISKFPIIYIRWSLNGKNFMMDMYDFETVTKDSNFFDHNFFNSTFYLD